MAEGSITIVGLGPGDGQLLTRQAWEVLAAAEVVYLRTVRHPAGADLPPAVRQVSFDHVYETADDFAAVYAHIVSEIIRLGRAPAGVVYAVPGHPHIGEATVVGIVAAANAAGLPVTIVPGISFVEPVLSAIGVDGLNGLQLFDAIDVASYNYPPLSPDAPVLLGQVYSRLMASELKLALMAIYPDEHEVFLVHSAGTAAQAVEKVPLYAIDRSPQIDHLSSLYVPAVPVPASLPALAEAVAVLRGPNGCPWDQEQTSQSLRSGFLEEASEVLDAIDAADAEALCEELGDLLLHIVMQTQIAGEEEAFKLTDVVAGIYAKLKRRHPHVWGDWEVADSAEVVTNWARLKAAERAANQPSSLLDNIPQALPALAQAQKIQARVRKVGFDWPDVAGVVAKLHEEIAEISGAETPAGQQQELGDALFALVNWARWLDIDAETALREANRRFTRRFRYLEQLATGRGQSLAELGLDNLEALWQEAKTALHDAPPGSSWEEA